MTTAPLSITVIALAERPEATDSAEKWCFYFCSSCLLCFPYINWPHNNLKITEKQNEELMKYNLPNLQA